MNLKADQLEVFSNILEDYGRNILQEASNQILSTNYGKGKIHSALIYHAKFLSKVLPNLPSLITLSCEAVGGKNQKISEIGAALTLFVEASNIHDDILDQSASKHSRKTIFGKFGNGISLLTGDVLLVQGAFALCKACESLPQEQKNAIIDLTFKALNEISSSTAKEIELQRKLDISPVEYRKIIQMRAAVPEIFCRIGGILGGGTLKIIDILGLYGRTYGVVGTVIDEFMDFMDYEKFSNRLKNECVPLPLLCSLQNLELRKQIIPYISSFNIDEKNYEIMNELVMDSKEVSKLKNEIILLSTKCDFQITTNPEIRDVRNLSTLIKVLKVILNNV